MKRFLATTALALMAFGPAAAETASTTFLPAVEHGVRASNFIGKNVYVAEGDISKDAVSVADKSWNKVGDINDVIMGPDGGVDVVLVDVGGFLGLGAKTVAVSLKDIHRVPDSGAANSYFLVFNGTKAALEAAPEFKDAMIATADATAQTAAPATDDMANTKAVELGTLTAEELTGQTVENPDGTNVGAVSDLTLDANQKINGIVVDVGGFLGMGAHTVVLSPEMLSVKRTEQNTIRVFVNQTKDQLKALPDYKKP